MVAARARRSVPLLFLGFVCAAALLAPATSARPVSGSVVPAGLPLHWTLVKPTHAPSARAWVTMADDRADGYVVLYGGYNAYSYGAISDTWTWHAGNWTQRNPMHHPGGSVGLTLVYDPDLKGVVTFGGQYALPETWLFKAGNWSIIHTTGATPPARFGYSMAYDSFDDEIVMFGGQAGNNSNIFLSDTWVFNGTSWSPITVAHHPNGRIGASMVYDAASTSVLLVGGRNTSTGVGEPGTWSFQAGVWNWLYGAHTPAARNFPFVAALGNGTPVLYGGTTPNGAYYYNGTWEFFSGRWNHVHALNQPSGRNDAAFAWDGQDHYLLLFGGSVPTPFGYHSYTMQTWELV